MSKVGCCVSGPRHRYDFNLPVVEHVLKMPFFPYPVHCAVPGNLGEFVLCPREGTLGPYPGSEEWSLYYTPAY